VVYKSHAGVEARRMPQVISRVMATARADCVVQFSSERHHMTGGRVPRNILGVPELEQ